MAEISQQFTPGHYVKILDGLRKNEEATLDEPLSREKRTWVVILADGEREFYQIQDLLPIKTTSVEEFRRFLEN